MTIMAKINITYCNNSEGGTDLQKSLTYGSKCLALVSIG